MATFRTVKWGLSFGLEVEFQISPWWPKNYGPGGGNHAKFQLEAVTCHLSFSHQNYETKEDFAGNCFNVSTIVEGIPAQFDSDTLSTRLCGDQFEGKRIQVLVVESINCAANMRFLERISSIFSSIILMSSEYCKEAQLGYLFFFAANGGVALIVLGLIHFLMCLSANYAHIKGDWRIDGWFLISNVQLGASWCKGMCSNCVLLFYPEDGLKLREYEEAKYSIDTRDYASFWDGLIERRPPGETRR